ncbi:MAG: ATP-binding protein [Alphaproteobacteria bacterium]|nr:ATP-binding protein [Alphaproteobacteria bacterium]
MEPISEEDVRARLGSDNPWWLDPQYVVPESLSPKRVYFQPFKELALNFGIRRAAVLLGPRRVGKTYMTKQLIQAAMQRGIAGKNILYVSIDAPIYLGMTLEKFIELMPQSDLSEQRLVIFDEIQYLKNWEGHLKDLVDNRPNIKFVVSGSAAAALQLKSRESGAGRFSDFMLPPLTFYEFLLFLGEGEAFIRQLPGKPDERPRYEVLDIKKLNSRFVDYLNFGGYPEAVLNEEVRKNAPQFIKNDIIDKVLLNDLPSLYGINNPQLLKKLFAFLAYNAGNEASFENICQGSGIPKPTIRAYLEYLESAFLVIKLSTIDDNCKTLQRERNFKIYLNNPSMRAAFFAPVSEDDTARIGLLAECAVFSQWQHSSGFTNLRYARWRNEGEVDIVYLAPEAQKPQWIGEIKWSDHFGDDPEEVTKHITYILRKHKGVMNAVVTTRSIEAEIEIEGRTVHVHPTAAYCYMLGRNIMTSLGHLPKPKEPEQQAMEPTK